MSILCIPAIDLRGGRVVRLRQGDFARETCYATDPVELAARYETQGAHWLHLVDLDAARDGAFQHGELLRTLRARTGLKLQVGGGVRRIEDVQALLDAGADRVVVGTLAVRDPQLVCGWLREFGAERICVALDARRGADGRWMLPVAGWTEAGTRTLQELLERYDAAGVRHVLCTDIQRDGMMQGPNVELYAQLARDWPDLELIASGGVSGLSDVLVLRAAGVRAVVLGRALLDGQLDLAQALAC